jgi:hypothetical protein
LCFIILWFILRRILNSISAKMNNRVASKEGLLDAIEEIRGERKELNKNNLVK